jgi:hypothetical protein
MSPAVLVKFADRHDQVVQCPGRRYSIAWIAFEDRWAKISISDQA